MQTADTCIIAYHRLIVVTKVRELMHTGCNHHTECHHQPVVTNTVHSAHGESLAINHDVNDDTLSYSNQVYDNQSQCGPARGNSVERYSSLFTCVLWTLCLPSAQTLVAVHSACCGLYFQSLCFGTQILD